MENTLWLVSDVRISIATSFVCDNFFVIEHLISAHPIYRLLLVLCPPHNVNPRKPRHSTLNDAKWYALYPRTFVATIVAGEREGR